MTSHIAEAALNDYVDGVLSAEARAGVERHLAECDACASSAAALFRLVARLGALPRSVPPREDLRPAIRARIGAVSAAVEAAAGVPAEAAARPGATPGDGARRLRLRRRFALAAAAVLLVASTATVTRWLVLREGRGATGAVGASAVASTGATEAEASDVALAAFHRDESRYTAAIAELEGALRRERTRLSPETLGILRRNLEVIDRALAESRAALARDPANAELGRMILSTYSQKLELLRRARESTS
ncbi:MAG TPA: zf-HC2 domain-containing protein [Longimicrobiales bacterium]|nr:zf-HC2 domain-containing protein [Longimicrobiales bacterium]